MYNRTRQDPKKFFDSALRYIYYALGNIKLICLGLRSIVNIKKPSARPLKFYILQISSISTIKPKSLL